MQKGTHVMQEAVYGHAGYVVCAIGQRLAGWIAQHGAVYYRAGAADKRFCRSLRTGKEGKKLGRFQ